MHTIFYMGGGGGGGHYIPMFITVMIMINIQV